MIDEDYDEAYDGPSAEDDPWMTTSEVLEILDISRTTLANWRARGMVTAYRLGVSRGVRFKKSELLDLIEQAKTVTRI